MGLVILLEHTHTLTGLSVRFTTVKHREKVLGPKFGGNQTQASNSLPVESHKTVRTSSKIEL